MPDTDDRPPITTSHILVSVLIVIALGLTAALFLTPGSSPYFWPIAVALVLVGAAAMLVPMKPKG